MSELPTGAKSPDHSLFHRKHAISLTWAVVGGLITASVVTAYQANRPPQKVIILNPDTVTRTVRANDSLSLRLFESMVAELRGLRLNGVAVSQQGSKPRNARVPATGSSASPRTEAPVDLPIVNLPVSGAYYSPSGSKGYTVAPLGTFARYSCPASPARPGDEIALTATFRSPDQVDGFSPIDVSINREKGDTLFRLLHQQYQTRATNLIILAAPRDTGRYSIEFGVYVKGGGRSGEFPPLYEAACPLVVLK
jgi:hypothetical protein